MTAAVDGLLEFVALDDSDGARLVGLHALLAPYFLSIAGMFLATARARSETAAIVHGVDDAVLQQALIDWMSTGLLGPHDKAFVERRSRIGRRHAEVELPQQYLISGTTAIRRAYHDRIASAYSPAEARAVGVSVDKLLDLELAIMLCHYQHDSEARLLAGERRRRLEQVEALQTLCAGLAHEVRNPLNSAKLQLELAERRIRRVDDSPRLVDPIEQVGHEIDRLTTLLDEFLAFAQPYALHAEPQDVVRLVHDVLERNHPLAAERGAELRFVDSHGPIVADVDGEKLQQIVDSLVANAVEAVSPGGHVMVAVVPLDGHVHIRVTDNGRGIPDGVLPRIYEPFFSTKDGTGMGLSIVHSLVALHRGTIEVDSSTSGTTFDIALPRRSSV